MWRDDSYILISLDLIKSKGMLPLDIYLKVGDNFVKVVGKIPPVESATITRYLSKNSNSVWIKIGDLKQNIRESYRILSEKIPLSTSPSYSEAYDFCKAVEICFLDISLFSFDPEKILQLRSVLEFGAPVFRDPGLRKIVLRILFWNIECEITRRAVFGGILGVCLLLEFGDCQNHVIGSLLLGGILRDISLRNNPNELHRCYGDFAIQTVVDQSIFFKHTIDSIEILMPLGILDDYSETLIRQHHEHPQGSGFPVGLNKSDIYFPAICVHLSDLFVNVIERRLQQDEKINLDYLIQDFSKIAATFDNKIFDKTLPVISSLLANC